MKLKLFISLLIFSLTTFAAPEKKSEFVGYKHKGVLYGETLPNGVKDLGGGLLSDENYGVSRFQKGKKFMLWLEKITDRDKKGVPSWEVKDVLTFDNLKKNRNFHFPTVRPAAKRQGNLDLIVMTEHSEKENL